MALVTFQRYSFNHTRRRQRSGGELSYYWSLEMLANVSMLAAKKNNMSNILA